MGEVITRMSNTIEKNKEKDARQSILDNQDLTADFFEQIIDIQELLVTIAEGGKA
ncbi:MAG: hypothetical protein RR420_05495 [Anaerovoracaceae bacterium]